MNNIRLESLSVTGLGPISHLEVKFGDVNLIYGRNERGKTFLTEFLLRSLFRNTQKTRRLQNSGQVLVSGLDKSIKSFDPETKKKIEDYVFSAEDNHPVDLSRLCVVKGGELSFQPLNENPIDKNILKTYLSDQQVFDKILKDIPNSTQDSHWENKRIVFGRQASNIKELFEKTEQLKQVDQLLSEVNNSFSQGRLSEQKQQLTLVNHQIDAQLAAKRYLAFQLSEKKNEKKKQIEKITKNDLTQINNLLVQLDISQGTIESLSQRINTLEKSTEHYSWVQTAIAEIEKRPMAQTGKQWIVFFIIGMVFLIATLVFPFLNKPFISLGSGVLTLVFIILGLIQNQKSANYISDNVEVNNIFSEFDQRFNTHARALATLVAKEKELSPLHNELTTYQRQLSEEEKKGIDFENEIKRLFSGLLSRKLGKKEDYVQLLSDLNNEYEALEKSINELDIKLANLDVSVDEYIQNKTANDYEQQLVKSLQTQKQSLEESIKSEEKHLEILKNNVSKLTNDDLSVDWGILIENLRKKRVGIRNEMIHLKAIIGAGIAVTNVVAQMRQGEDERIRKALSSDSIAKPLYPDSTFPI